MSSTKHSDSHITSLRRAQLFWQEHPIEWMTYDEYWSTPPEERAGPVILAVAAIERKYLQWLEIQILKGF